MKAYLFITNIAAYIVPSLLLAANAETTIGAAGWILLGSICAGMRQWGMMGILQIVEATRSQRRKS